MKLQSNILFSLIIPTFNEEKLGFLRRNLSEHFGSSESEIICVDGGSTDKTFNFVREFKAQLIISPGTNRAARLNAGALQAKGDWIVFLHPRSFLPKEALLELNSGAHSSLWGAWTHQFDRSQFLLKFTSWYSNRVRGDLRSIFYLDHCLFVRRDIAERFKFRLFSDISIFEDTEFCLRLRRLSAGRRFKTKIATSSVRFRENGFFYQSYINQLSKLKYFFGFDHSRLNQRYERGLRLNGEL